MIKLINELFLICLPCFGLVAQTIHNSNFHWDIIGKCGPSETCTEVYLKAETDPLIEQLNEEEFESLVENAINSLNLDARANGSLKLKLLFITGQSLCLSEVGLSKIEIEHEKLVTLSKRLNVIDKITHGTMHEMAVNTYAYLYININDGKMESMRNVNFKPRA